MQAISTRLGGHRIRRVNKSRGVGVSFPKARQAKGVRENLAIGDGAGIWHARLTFKTPRPLIFLASLKTRGEGGETVGGYNVYRQNIL